MAAARGGPDADLDPSRVAGKTMATSYSAKDITVLEGLEPVRKRPGMYIGGVGSAGLHHLVWEILDNAVDEAMNGHAANVEVTLHGDGSSVTVVDDGRGMPVDRHPKTDKNALEVIFTTLHAGGKFENRTYRTAGGLHGVGASVVNALSQELVATSKRDGFVWQQTFRRGRPVASLRKLKPARGSGTTIRFHPDPRIFPKTTFDPGVIRQRLEIASYVHGGVRFVFADEAGGTKEEFRHENGLPDYVACIVRERGSNPVHEAPFVFVREHADTGSRIEVVLQWTEATDEHLRSYVNGIPTASGGTHENGVRAGLGKAVRNFIETHNLTPKGVSLTADDIREGLTGVVSIFVPDPQFQGQTKDRLNNPELAPVLDGAMRPALEHWLNHNISVAEAIVARIVLAARAREASRAGAAIGVAQERDLEPAQPPRQAERLHGEHPRRQRAVHRRGRLGRRLGQAGTRSDPAGHPPAARQGAERRERLDIEGAREQGALGCCDSARLRPRKDLRHHQAALRSHHHPRRRRFGREPHSHAAADLLLPVPSEAHHPREGVPGPTAPLPRGCRQGDLLGTRRRTPRRHRKGAYQRPRGARDHPLQGAGAR